MVWLSNLPDDMIAHNKLKENGTTQGHVYVEVRKPKYGPPQAGLLGQELFEKRLNEE